MKNCSEKLSKFATLLPFDCRHKRNSAGCVLKALYFYRQMSLAVKTDVLVHLRTTVVLPIDFFLSNNSTHDTRKNGGPKQK